jgi:hypothetical protein
MVSVSEGRRCDAVAAKAGGSTGSKRQFIPKSYRRLDVTATAFAFLPGAVAGCFRNRERANSPTRTDLNWFKVLGEEEGRRTTGLP